jgi:hypothetical protein
MASDEAALHDFADRSIREQLQNPENLRDLLADALPDLVAGFDFKIGDIPRKSGKIGDIPRKSGTFLVLLGKLGKLVSAHVCWPGWLAPANLPT